MIDSYNNAQNLPHAFLLTGPDDEAKMFYAKQLAKDILHGIKTKNCRCGSCLMIDRGLHPDLYVSNDRAINIEEARKIKDKFSQSPFYSKGKICIITKADKMANEAANAILKTIEEPTGNSFFVLFSKSRLSVMPTICSRAVEVKFFPKAVWYEKFFLSGEAKKNMEDFQKLPSYKKFFHMKKFGLENKEDAINFLDSWLIKIRRELLDDFSRDRLALARKLFKAKKIIAGTNANPQIIMEEICVARYL